MFGWLLTVRSKRFIIRCLVFIKDTYLYFLTMWVVHKDLYTNNQEHSEMKYPMFEVWTIGTTNPSKSLPDKHFIPYQIHCVVLCLCVECLGSHWQQKEISSWAMVHIQSDTHWCSKTMILSQWIYLLIEALSKWQIQKMT